MREIGYRDWAEDLISASNESSQQNGFEKAVDGKMEIEKELKKKQEMEVPGLRGIEMGNEAREHKKEQDRQDRDCIWEDMDYFHKIAHSLAPEQSKREQALSGIRQAVAKKVIMHTPSLWELALIELQYISPFFWAVQGLLVGTLILFLENPFLDERALADYLRSVSVLAAWMGVVACGSLSRHFSQKMAEVEQSCYFNLTQMWTIRMALAGTVDIFVLTACSGRIAWKTEQPFGQVCLYVLVPFVLSNVCCMFFFTALRGGRNRYSQLVMAFVTGLMAAMPGQLPEKVYVGPAVWGWAATLIAGIGLYLWQLRHMYGKIRRGEMVCWN